MVTKATYKRTKEGTKQIFVYTYIHTHTHTHTYSKPSLFTIKTVNTHAVSHESVTVIGLPYAIIMMNEIISHTWTTTSCCVDYLWRIHNTYTFPLIPVNFLVLHNMFWSKCFSGLEIRKGVSIIIIIIIIIINISAVISILLLSSSVGP
jgi:hypothetical protein